MNTELKTPYQLFRIECGKGWLPIVTPVVEFIEEYNHTHEESSIEIVQIKEKWSQLEIYLDYNNVPAETVKKVQDMVADARREASVTCEICGSKENIGVTMNNWHTTICLDCLEKMVKEANEKGFKWQTKRIWKSSDGKVFLVTQNGAIEQPGDKLAAHFPFSL